MTKFEMFDAQKAFTATSRVGCTDVLSGGNLAAGIELYNFHFLNQIDAEFQQELTPLSDALYAAGNRGLYQQSYYSIFYHLKGLTQGVKDSPELTFLKSEVLDGLSEAIHMEYYDLLNKRAQKLGALVGEYDLWVRLPDTDIAEAVAEERGRAFMTSQVARLVDLDIHYTDDGRPAPVAVLEGKDGRSGLYPHRLELYPAFDQDEV